MFAIFHENNIEGATELDIENATELDIERAIKNYARENFHDRVLDLLIEWSLFYRTAAEILYEDISDKEKIKSLKVILRQNMVSRTH
ncbi:MAG: hypothetical protein K6T66_15700 [Peptococcaceae bacterium]|nr:hypothetical protein [Peptococcaceae bacterium]